MVAGEVQLQVHYQKEFAQLEEFVEDQADIQVLQEVESFVDLLLYQNLK